jgi:hypothetical protein
MYYAVIKEVGMTDTSFSIYIRFGRVRTEEQTQASSFILLLTILDYAVICYLVCLLVFVFVVFLLVYAACEASLGCTTLRDSS